MNSFANHIRDVLDKLLTVVMVLVVLLALWGEFNPYLIDTSLEEFYLQSDPKLFTGLFHGITSIISLLRQVWVENSNLYCIKHSGYYDLGFYVGFCIQSSVVINFFSHLFKLKK